MNPPKPLVCNTTVLSNFALINRLDLLTHALALAPLTTPLVVDEISAGVQAGYKHLVELENQLISGNSPFRILALDPEELLRFRDLRLRLHAGEASCLAVAFNRRHTLGTDDLAARNQARGLGVPVIGTVGLLVLCRHGLLSLSEANGLLQTLIDAGYRSPVPRLDDFWK